MFDAKRQEKLRYYVYGLFHPDEPNWPFYIGKGSGNRVFSHAAGQLQEEEFSTDSLSAKAEVIAETASEPLRARLRELTFAGVELELPGGVVKVPPEAVKYLAPAERRAVQTAIRAILG